jgi:predicted membrane-bound spermidine synthase
MQSFLFSIPGLSGGLLVAYFMNLMVRYFIFGYAQNTTDYYLSDNSILIGVLLGIFLPLISNIYPI